MANAPVHAVVGGSVVVGLYMLHKKFISKEELDPVEMFAAFCFGAAGGLFADILEPANSPNHRAFFHSIIFAAILFYGKDKLCEILDLDENGKRYLNWFISAYASHLALDARTPKGLPII